MTIDPDGFQKFIDQVRASIQESLKANIGEPMPQASKAAETAIRDVFAKFLGAERAKRWVITARLKDDLKTVEFTMRPEYAVGFTLKLDEQLP